MARKGGDAPTEVRIDDLRTFLREEAERGPIGKPSTYEQVVALLPEIDALFARRRTRAEVRDLLASKGLEMSLGTFTQYYAKAKRGTEPNENSDANETGRKPDHSRKNETNTNPRPKANDAPSTAGAKPEEGATPDLRPRNRDI